MFLAVRDTTFRGVVEEGGLVLKSVNDWVLSFRCSPFPVPLFLILHTHTLSISLFFFVWRLLNSSYVTFLTDYVRVMPVSCALSQPWIHQSHPS